MFRSVPTDEEPECRRDLEALKLHRRAQFAGWSEATCASYLQDLEQARAAGRNLMTLKYARMDDRIPPLSRNPRIAWIRQRLVDWQREVIARYPKLMRGARTLENFSTYLAAELETYSDRTLELLAGDVESCQRAGENMSLAVYQALARATGHASLEALEESLP
ncbi:MAG: DUF4125 family protein [Spirochaetales bacterium]|nr:DUF4125 family protein [Spirochaetales bacterium]